MNLIYTKNIDIILCQKSLYYYLEYLEQMKKNIEKADKEDNLSQIDKINTSIENLKNNINISMTCYSGDPKKPSNNIVNNSEIENVPIQRWVNLFFSVYGRTLDIYLDGKLVRTNILPGIANINQSAPTFITPMGGFYGWTSKFQYWPNASDPQQAWNVYKAGYGGNSILSSLIGQYQVKVALINNGQETSSLEI